jgi:hypothetical protein
MPEELYKDILKFPDKISGANVLVRLIDGMAFRYKCSLVELDDSFLEFRPVAGSMNLRELMEHIHKLTVWLYQTVIDNKFSEQPAGGLHELKNQTLLRLKQIRDRLHNMDDTALENMKVHNPWSDEEIPIWLLINGPLADILTHTGQILSWRRIAGSPVPEANTFRGKPADRKT